MGNTAESNEHGLVNRESEMLQSIAPDKDEQGELEARQAAQEPQAAKRVASSEKEAARQSPSHPPPR